MEIARCDQSPISNLWFLNGNRCFDGRMILIIDEGEVVVLEIKDGGDGRIELHLRQWIRVAGELQLGLLQVIEIKVSVAEGVDKVAWLQANHLRYHQREQGVGSDVEGDAQENVGAALVQLAGEFALSHVKLVEQVAGG